MSESQNTPQAAPETLPASPSNDGDAFQRAENLLVVGGEDKATRARQAFAAIEGHEAADRPSTAVTDSKALAVREDGSESDTPATAEEVGNALDEGARTDGVDAAKDSSQIVWSQTPHNI